jgi:hypothetical protein
MKPKSHRPKIRREYRDGKLELVPEFSATVDPRVETHVCACVSKDQLTWFRAFMRRRKFRVHQSHQHTSGGYTYSFFVPFPRMDRRWHDAYRELFEAGVKMVGDLD